jgi:moderate conductance mechanosensitive channel
VLGVDSVKGSQLIIPVVFKTLATKQYGPMREFQRRVRLAFEEHHLLPGDPNRVFNPGAGGAAKVAAAPEEAAPAAKDPTTIKPQETNPFSGE